MTTVSGRWKLGILLALGTTLMWGVLPITLQLVLVTLDAETTTFFRFLQAATLLTAYLIFTGRLTQRSLLKLLSPKLALQLLAAGVLLCCNYGFYIFALGKSTAEGVQVMMQLAPMLLLLSGIWLFKETFSTVQWLGFIIFVSGLGLFFNQHIQDLFISMNSYGVGLLLAVISAICWTGYAITQKLLLKEFSSAEILVILYWIGTLVFLPISDFSTLPELNPLGWSMLVFCGLNTLIAYGCFAEAQAHIEASRVSATLAITPLITVAIMQLYPIPGIAAESISWLTIIGALLVVCGSILAVIAGNKRSDNRAEENN